MLYQSLNFKTIHNSASSALTLDIRDRGLAFGDGVFTTARITLGKVEYLDLHLQRLQTSCQRLFIDGVNWLTLSNEMKNAASRFKNACLKIIITAGQSKRGYARAAHTEPSIIVMVTELPTHYTMWRQEGIHVEHSQTRVANNPLLAGIKHLNRLEQVLIRRELDALNLNGQNIDELLVFDVNDHLVECNTSNVFWQKDNQWYTPVLDTNGVNGIIRQRILTLMPHVKQVKATVSDLDGISAMFICNALLPIAPVANYVGKQLDITASVSVLEQLK